MKDEHYAGFWISVGANLIDLIIFIFIYFFSYWFVLFVFIDLLSLNTYYFDLLLVFNILQLLPFGLSYFWIALDKRNKSCHDKLAGTVVIRKRQIEKVVFEKPKKITEA